MTANLLTHVCVTWAGPMTQFWTRPRPQHNQSPDMRFCLVTSAVSPRIIVIAWVTISIIVGVQCRVDRLPPPDKPEHDAQNPDQDWGDDATDAAAQGHLASATGGRHVTIVGRGTRQDGKDDGHKTCVEEIQGALKNTERYTAHTSVSWPNLKQWVIIHTSHLMMIIRQSIYVYIFSQSSKGKLVNWKHTAPRIIWWITETRYFAVYFLKTTQKRPITTF